MRVSESMRVSMVTYALARNAERMSKLAREAASGERVAAPSDDPAAYAFRVRGEGRVRLLAARQEAVTRALGDMRLAEGVLASGSDLVVRARELAVQMVNGSMDATARAEARHERRQLSEACR